MTASESASDAAGGCRRTRNSEKTTPRKVNKAAREKKKRDQINELFFKLGASLALDHSSHGKDSLLKETMRILKHLRCLVDSLHKDNASLVSEFNYIEIEKNELAEEVNQLKTAVQMQKKSLNCYSNNLSVLNKEAAAAAALRSYLSPMNLEDSTGGDVPAKVTKPYPKYPSDSWPSQILEQHPSALEIFDTPEESVV